MITRRAFIRTIGKGSAAVAIVGVGACTTAEPAATTLDGLTATTQPEPTTTTITATTSSSATPTTAVDPTSGEWRRVNLGFVSAYVFLRGGEAALVDTGVSGSTPQIESVLGGLGLGWNDLSTIILTHHHGDHVGSLPEIMEAATDATAFAGAEDIPNITSPRPVTAVTGGDVVFGLEIVATPGHTPGHISILHPGTSALVAGDAIVGENGGVAGPPARFTADQDAANASIATLAQLEYDVIYFGHGEPVMSGGSGMVAEFADSL